MHLLLYFWGYFLQNVAKADAHSLERGVPELWWYHCLEAGLLQQVDRQQEEGGTNHAQDDHAGDQGAGHWVHWLGAGRRCWKMEVWKQTLERTQLFMPASFYMSSLFMCSVIQPITINYGRDNSSAHLPSWELLTGFSSERMIWQRFVNIFLNSADALNGYSVIKTPYLPNMRHWLEK